MDQTTKDKLTVNLSNSLKMWSNYVMGGAALVWAAYLALPVTCVAGDAGCTSQHQLQVWVSTTLHIPALLLPIITGVLGIAARLYPQKSITPIVAEAKSADAPQAPPAP